MQIPERPLNEQQRLQAVSEYNLIDTLPEEDYDSISKLVANICNVPITLITILDQDRNFFKSHHGIDLANLPEIFHFVDTQFFQKSHYSSSKMLELMTVLQKIRWFCMPVQFFMRVFC